MGMERTGRRDEREALRRRLDERERSEQFRTLPPAFQAELRGRWREDLARFDARYAVRRRSLGRAVVEAAAVLFVARLAFGPSVVGLLVSLPLGAATGALWYVTRAQRFLCMVEIVPAFLLLQLVGPRSILVFFEALLVLCLAAAVGATREFRFGDESVM